MNRESARLLQRLAVEATGSKIFKNLDRNFTKARWSANIEAGIASEIEIKEKTILNQETRKITKRKSWRVKKVQPLMQLLPEKVLGRGELCWRQTQCEDRLVFVLSSDRADNIHFTHITLQNSKDPAKPRNSNDSSYLR